jgi:hypothetical protein
MENDEPVLSVGERFYKNHKQRVTTYQKANPEKMRAKCKAYNERIKDERPDLYKTVLESKRKYYYEVTKPKREEKKKLLGIRIAEQNI